MPPQEKSRRRPLRVEKPTRGADRNQDLSAGDAEDADPSLLPSLEGGLTLLDVEGGRGVGVLQSLVLDHLLMHDGPAIWVDAQGFATTTSMARLAPSQRLLERIHVVRGFTAYQHHAAIQRLPEAVPNAEERALRSSPSLIVAPAFDAQYAGSDTLHGDQASVLQARGLARLARYSRQYGAPVLVTRTSSSEFTAPIEEAADHHLECELTKFGPKFSGGDFDTLLYPDGEGCYQTTLAFWRQVLGERASQLGIEPASPPSPTDGKAEVGSGVLADGTTQSFTADPLVDARNASGRGW